MTWVGPQKAEIKSKRNVQIAAVLPVPSGEVFPWKLDTASQWNWEASQNTMLLTLADDQPNVVFPVVIKDDCRYFRPKVVDVEE